ATRKTRPPLACPSVGAQVATLRNCIFKQTMTMINAAYPGGTFPAAPAQYLNGSTKPLPDFTGQTVTSATGQLSALGFDVAVSPGEVASDQPEGTVASTTPGAGTKLSTGWTITINVSDGSQAKTVPNVVGEPLAQAEHDITNAGFSNPKTTCVVDPASPVGKVTASNPIAGWKGPASTVVTLTVHHLTCP
ncbi:MAG TPA: PASTA domain-containing protein, partial [Galbitalea sp.]|nr:PASTA domain-containing protein [Galbitalea sp.]